MIELSHREAEADCPQGRPEDDAKEAQTMPQAATRKVTISLPEELVAFADHKASEQRTTRSDVIGRLLEEHRASELDALAREGYELYAQEANDFAEQSTIALGEVLARERASR